MYYCFLWNVLNFGRLQPCTIVGDRNPVDDVMRIAFGNRAVIVALDRATTHIANPGDRNAVDREVIRAHALDLAAVRGGIA